MGATSENVPGQTFTPKEISNQPAYPRNLTRVFVVPMKKICIRLTIQNVFREHSDQAARMLGAHVQRYVF